MAIEDIGERLEGKGWIGVTVGAVLLAPVVFPAVGRALRPTAKNMLKGAFALADRARALAAETNEQIQDLVAEARSEYQGQPGEAGVMTMAAPGPRPTEVAVQPEEEELLVEAVTTAAEKREEAKPDEVKPEETRKHAHGRRHGRAGDEEHAEGTEELAAA